MVRSFQGWLGWAVVIVLLGAAGCAARAETAAPVTPIGQSAGAGEAAAVDALIRALEDPAVRARLVEALRAQGGSPAAPPAGVGAPIPPPTDAAIEVAPPPSSVARALTWTRAQLAGLARFAGDAVDIGQLADWLEIQASSTEARSFWKVFLTGMALCLVGGSAGYWAVRLALGQRHWQMRQQTYGMARRARVRLAVVLAMLELAPIVTFWLIALGLIALLDMPERIVLVANTVILIAGAALLFVALARILLRPHTPHLRLLPLDDAVAGDLYGALRRLILWALLGHALFSNVLLLGAPPGVFEGLRRIWGLVILGMVLAVVLRYRTDIGSAIGGSGGRLSMLRRFLAQIWLPVVVVYAVSAYFVWALNVYQGSELLVQGGLLSILVLLAVQPVKLLLRRWLQFMAGAEVSGPTAILQSRLQRYAAVLRFLLSILVYAAAAVAIGLAWELNLLDWLDGHVSGPFVALASDIAVVGLVCWGLWELLDLWFSLYFESVDETGARVQRSARSRTLLPLLRTSLLVLLVLGFLVASLTSFGLDVAPLLATAGVVGIAVGFGAQKLVQDVINGLFILFQNTISVGDVVTLADFTGTVERITVRTLELRDVEGALHTIPFSSVTTVTNVTRDFAYTMFDIGVAYKEDTETVMEVLRQVGAEFEAEAAQATDLLGALEVMGVQEFGDSAVTIRCRFRVQPLMQWRIRRAFLARVKRRFDELDIEIPFPQRTLHWPQPDADTDRQTVQEAKA